MRPSTEENEPGEEWIERAGEVADLLDRRYGVRESSAAYERLRYEGRVAGRPVLHLEDVTGIPFVSEVPGVEEYQHRARVRADSGDLFAAVTPPVPGYEEYNRERLGLGAPELVLAEPDGDRKAVARACRRPPAFEMIRRFGVRREGLVIHPYMATESVWKLAGELAETGLEVSVLGPPPPVLWIANDKARIAEINDELFDGAGNVATRVEATPEQMVEGLREFAGRFEAVGLKRTRCASATGNLVFESGAVKETGREELLGRVRRFLERTEWEPGEEVLVVEWVEASESPSTQTWIPPRDQGLPRVEGVYEQLLKAEERIFVGSRPSTLPEAVDRRIARASVVVGRVLQQLGYVGRCSFDFVVSGNVDGEWDVHMIECNGRWGGTSTPMHFVDRIVPGGRPPYVAMDVMDERLEGVEFEQLLERTGEELYDPVSGKGRFAFYNPGPLAESGKIDVVAIGETPAEAVRGVDEILPEIWGLHQPRE